jgi:hypothetical protein
VSAVVACRVPELAVGADEELAASLIADNRVLLAVTPVKPAGEWSVLGVEA